MKNLKLANYTANPLEDETLEGYTVFTVPISSLTENALEGTSLSPKEVARCKNFFALGLMYWLYNRPIQNTVDWIQDKFKRILSLLMQIQKLCTQDLILVR